LTDEVRILVVEDEVLVGDLVAAGLEEAGYAVATALDAENAIAMIEAGDANFRAVVTDINLATGGLTGWDVARRARELSADFPVVYMSGASASEWASNGVPNSLIIAKPFAIGQIVTAVSQLLNTTPAIIPE
jgi:DNA-binding response OmpR family regulator